MTIKEKIKIEEAKENDLPKILSLQKTAYLQEAAIYNDFTIPPLHQTIKSLHGEWKTGTILKVVSGGKIVGSIRACLKDGMCYIGKVIVHPDFQNQGIGKQLMEAIETVYKHAEEFELFTGIRSEKNLYLYQKLGYKKMEEETINKLVLLVYLRKKNNYSKSID